MSKQETIHVCNRIPTLFCASTAINLLIYNSFLKSILYKHLREYHQLHLLQKKAVRIITNSNYIAHTKSLLK